MVASWSGPWLLIKIQLGRMAWSTTRGMDPGGFAAALGDWRGGADVSSAGRCHPFRHRLRCRGPRRRVNVSLSPPARRSAVWGELDAIADAAAFLVSTQARWITGQHMPARESRARGPGDPQVA